MGKDKHTFKEIEKMRLIEAKLTQHIDGLAECFFQDESKRKIFSVIIASQIGGMAESVQFVHSVFPKSEKEH